MRRTAGVTITELLVVLGIIAILLGLLIPAVFQLRESARATVCKNNLRQIYMATSQFVETSKELPTVAQPGKFGGWMIEILPFIEQSNLKERIPVGQGLATTNEFDRPPAVYICPVRQSADPQVVDKMMLAHYVFVTDQSRSFFSLRDAPISLSIPWGNSPEMTSSEMRRLEGPHHGGFHFIQDNLHGVQYSRRSEDQGDWQR